jgi:hypothetical protein
VNSYVNLKPCVGICNSFGIFNFDLFWLNGCSFELEIMLGVCNSYGIPL